MGRWHVGLGMGTSEKPRSAAPIVARDTVRVEGVGRRLVARGGRRLGCRAQCSCVIRGNGAHAHIRKLSMKARAWDWGGGGGAGAHGSETPPFGGMVFVELSASCVLAQLKSGTQLTLCSATGYGKQRWGRPPEPIEPTAVSTTISQRRSCGSTTTGNNWIVDFFASGRASRGGRRRHHCRRATARARAVELNHRRRRAAPRARANI